MKDRDDVNILVRLVVEIAFKNVEKSALKNQVLEGREKGTDRVELSYWRIAYTCYT